MPGAESMRVPSRSSRHRGRVTGTSARNPAATWATYAARMATEPAREVLTWDLFGTAARELAQAVVDDGFVPGHRHRRRPRGTAAGRGDRLRAGHQGGRHAERRVLHGRRRAAARPGRPARRCSTPTRCPGCGRWSSTTSPTPARRSRSCRRSWRSTARRPAPRCCTPSRAPSSSRTTCGVGPTAGSSSRGRPSRRSSRLRLNQRAAAHDSGLPWAHRHRPGHHR